MRFSIDARLKIGIAGFGGDSPNPRCAEAIAALMRKARDELSMRTATVSGYSDRRPTLDFYASPLFADDIWLTAISGDDSTLSVVTGSRDVEGEVESGALAAGATCLTRLSDGGNTVGAFYSVTEWIASKIDLLVMLWDGSESARGGTMLAAERAAFANDIPCVRIDPNTLSLHYAEKNDERAFDERDLSDYISSLCGAKSTGLGDDDQPGKPFPLSGLWSILYRNFRKRHDRGIELQSDPYDPILHESYFDKDGDCPNARNHKRLVSFYDFYDSGANAASKRYRETIYFRSILPFAATVFLTVGFYVETIGRFCVPRLGSGRSPYFSILAYAAGIGFLVHALINLYAYRMSENGQIKNQLSVFINRRYCAEYLRNAIYFLPFGIPVRKRIVRPLDAAQIDGATIASMNRILRSLEPSSYSFDSDRRQESLRNMAQMLDDQIIYNENSRRRYERIAAALKKTSDVFFYVGFFIVIARGIIQFLIPELQVAFGQAFIDPARNGKSLKDFLQSFSNMLALMLPACASYFSVKLELNNFKNLSEHASKAKDELTRIERAVNRAKSQNAVSYETLHSLADEILGLQFSELTSWYALTATKNVTKI